MTKAKILVVDDIRPDLDYVEKLLVKQGYEPILAGSAQEALKLLDDSIDLVLSDVVMPQVDGFALVRAIRQNADLTDLPVIMITSISGKEERLHAVQVGANDFIAKPIDRVELRVRIDSLLRMKRARDTVKVYQRELEGLVASRTTELRMALQRLQAVMNGMSDGMVAIDVTRRILMANQAFCRLVGHDDEELRGRSLWDCLEGTEQRRNILALFEFGGERELKFPQWGGRTFSFVATPMEQGGQVLVMRDITEKRQAGELRDRFLQMLSHELRTPLNGILGLSELLLEFPEGEICPEDHELIRNIHNCGGQMGRIVEELMSFVELSSSEDELEEIEVDLDLVVQELLVELRERYREQQSRISLRVEGDPPRVLGKRILLQEMVRQLLDNALKFGRQGGEAELLLLGKGDRVRFICRDDGIGISNQEREKVFDSFYQTEDYATRTRGGLGLGLTIVKRIVDLHQGTIELESSDGCGTKVQIEFPRIGGSAE